MITLISIGVGQDSGSTIPVKVNGRIDSYKKDSNGEVVITKRNSEILNKIASSSGGEYIDGNITEEALENVDEIASTNGLTGIYIGPSDLSISLGLKPGLDRTEEKIVQAIDKIKLACKKHNIKVGIHCLSPEFLKNKIKEGFDLTTLASDVRFFTEMVSKKIEEARG